MKIELTNHAKYRLMERQIDVGQAKSVVKSDLKTNSRSSGKVVVSAVVANGRTVEVVYQRLSKSSVIILTAYYAS